MQYDAGWAQRTSKVEVWVAEAACRAGEVGGGDDGRTAREGRGARGGTREGYDACRGGGGEEVKKNENSLRLGADAGERGGPLFFAVLLLRLPVRVRRVLPLLVIEVCVGLMLPLAGVWRGREEEVVWRGRRWWYGAKVK